MAPIRPALDLGAARRSPGRRRHRGSNRAKPAVHEAAREPIEEHGHDHDRRAASRKRQQSAVAGDALDGGRGHRDHDAHRAARPTKGTATKRSGPATSSTSSPSVTARCASAIAGRRSSEDVLRTPSGRSVHPMTVMARTAGLTSRNSWSTLATFDRRPSSRAHVVSDARAVTAALVTSASIVEVNMELQERRRA
jgi:hypothetical protein